MRVSGLLFILFTLSGFAGEADHEFFVKRSKEDRTIFQIEPNQEMLGSIEKGGFNEYFLRDVSENLVATASMQGNYRFGKLNIVDSENKLISIIEQETAGIPKFSIFVPPRKKLATVEMDLWKKTIKIKDESDEHQIAVISKSDGTWTITVENSAAISQNRSLIYTFMILIPFHIDFNRADTERIVDAVLGLLMLPFERCPYHHYHLSTLETNNSAREELDWAPSMELEAEEIEALLESEKLTSEQKSALRLLLEQRITDLD